MKRNIRNLISAFVLIAFVWIGTATSKDEEIISLKATIEFEGDSITIINNDSFLFNEYSLSIILPGGSGDKDATYNYYTFENPILAGTRHSIALSEFLNVNEESYPKLVVPEMAILNVWTSDKLGVLEVGF